MTEADVKEALKEIKRALSSCGCKLQGCKGVYQECPGDEPVGQDVMNGLNPGQMVIKIVNEELVKLMGSETTEIKLQPGKCNHCHYDGRTSGSR